MNTFDNRRHPMTPNVIEPAAAQKAVGDAITLSPAVRNYLALTVRETIDDDPEFAEQVEVLLGPLYAMPQPVSNVSTLGDALRSEALGLCDAVENINDLPPVKYALQAGRAVTKVRDAAAALATQKSREVKP